MRIGAKSLNSVQGIAGQNFDKKSVLESMKYGSEKDRMLYEWVGKLQSGYVSNFW